ncbi:DNA recombination protein RmuC [Pseudonocardia sp. TMWB2A]|uniref:DNA recombination protein RmuC n=1 Tax=Pseudonocardia sp. TMWB2A TaxID=687430 RepID=UPI00307E1751
MSEQIFILILIVAVLVAGLVGWLVGARSAAAAKAECGHMRDRFNQAIIDLEESVTERDEARLNVATLTAQRQAQEAAHQERITELNAAREAMAHQFSSVGAELLDRAQSQFLERANQRFKQSEEASGQELKALLQPVSERLQKYEEQVQRIENERREAYGNLQGLMDQMRAGQDQVRSEAARLVNSLRNAPKARGRWGEQQLRNVLESCGLSEHADFRMEVSQTQDDGTRLRPDVIVRIPGGKSLIIDAKVSLNAYQDAFNAEDEHSRSQHMAVHASAMKTHVNALGAKAYQDQFDDTPDYVIMFVPGEHFLSAALEQDPDLWDFAFGKRVLLATPTNLIAIARTVASVWRQEALAREAKQVAALGKEMHERLAVVAAHLKRVGGGLGTAVNAYNQFVSSFESRVLTTGRRFADLSVDTGGKEIADIPAVETLPRYAESVAGEGETDQLPAPEDDAVAGKGEVGAEAAADISETGIAETGVKASP